MFPITVIILSYLSQTTSHPYGGSGPQVQLAQTVSLPSSSHNFVARASGVTSDISSRLARTARLDKYMRVLKEKCPAHFGNSAATVPAANHRCTTESNLPMHLYRDFKLSFTFERYTYCFQCCLPQSRHGNGEEPACHAGFSYRTGEKCPFAGFIFKAVFCMWHNEVFRNLMIKELGEGAPLDIYDNFLKWIVLDSPDPGRYHNLVEVFLWLCSAVEKVKPKFFN